MSSFRHFSVTDGASREAETSVAASGLPRSAIDPRDGLIGLGSFAIAWLLVVFLKPPQLAATWLILLATATPMLVRELWRAGPVGRRERERIAVLPWLLGFTVATAPFLLLHAQGIGLSVWAATWGVAAPALLLRILVEAARNRRLPGGGLPLMLGMRLLGKSHGIAGIAAAARLWSLKAIFVPLYALSLFSLVGGVLRGAPDSPVAWLTLAIVFAYTIDLSFGLAGYLFASNDLLPTIRSTQPRVSGWIVCLLCYEPAFEHWPAFKAVVMQEVGWPHGFVAAPATVGAATGLIALLGLYISATVCFGLRFSNLSNRGIVTTGPYRYMKHPAYFAHVGNAWIITLFFVRPAGTWAGLSQLLVPLAFTVLYRLRAVTEERHLSEDPEYRAYSDWIARHGIVARVRARYYKLRSAT